MCIINFFNGYILTLDLAIQFYTSEHVIMSSIHSILGMCSMTMLNCAIQPDAFEDALNCFLYVKKYQHSDSLLKTPKIHFDLSRKKT